MKNKKIKKICARLGALMSALILLGVMVLPCFAVMSEETAQDLYWGLDIGETPNDPLHIILNSSGMVDDTTYLNSELWYRGTFANGATQTYAPTIPNIYIPRGNQPMVYWCIVYESVAGDILDISYGNGDITYNTITSGGTTTRKFQFYGSVTGSFSTIENILQLKVGSDGTFASSCVIDGTTRTNDTVETRIRFGLVSPSNTQPSAAFPLLSNSGIMSTEINVYPQSVQRGVEIGLNMGGITEEDVLNAYNNGYDVGYNEALANEPIMVNFVTALFRAPMEFIDSVLDFTIFGINFATAFRVLITMCIIAVVVVVVWKAVR